MYKKILVILSIIFCFTMSFTIPTVNALEQDENIEEVENETEGEKEEGVEEVLTTEEEKEEGVEEVLTTEEVEVLEDEEEPTTNSETGTSSGQTFEEQKVLVKITKVDEEGNLLPGATLQVLQVIDGKEEIIEEWVSGDEVHEILLPNGKYILRELLAPEGYDIAPDQEFEVKVEIIDIDAGSDASATPCPHYTGTQMYYVEIKGEKHEVYCINQNWDTPDDNSQYDGEILDTDSIRDYTKQTTPVDINDAKVSEAVLSDGPIDVSEQSLSNQELYDKILDIIYHRYTAVEALRARGLTYTTEEIRFITEVALKNYTNPGLAEIQCGKQATPSLLEALNNANVKYKRYNNTRTYEPVEDGRYVCYIKHNYRDFVYVPDAPLGSDISVIDFGNGNSFGQMVAGHWNYFDSTSYLHPDADPATQKHNAKNNQADRDTVARYYELYLYLINGDTHHPADMNLYIYSSNTTPQNPAKNNYDGKYQNLLGITGYHEYIEQQEQEVEMVNKYNTDTITVNVEKIWEDWDDCDNVRPKEIIVYLHADGVIIDKLILSDEYGWNRSFENLPLFDKAHKIEYTISEDKKALNDLYDVVIKGNAEDGFIITNYYSPKGGDNPPTGDNININLIVLFISSIGMLSIMYLKKYAK